MATQPTTTEKTPEEVTSTQAASSMHIEIEDVTPTSPNRLHRRLLGRHMQMLAIGGSIGAGFFVGSGGALFLGGPASLLLGFSITGLLVLCTILALGELTVMYPVNGAFYIYMIRFIDPAWGFTIGWQYAIGWLITLPFEIISAGLTINYWHEYNIGIWVAVFLTVIAIVQFFGVRVEFVLGVIKLIAVAGFIIFGIIVDCGGVPTDDRGYIGFRYWSGKDGNSAFRNGFAGFASVFVLAAFAYGGSELVGLAAAEAEDPRKSLPKATKQVFWRIAGVYVLSSLIIGITVPNNSPDLLGATGANTKASPFVLAIQYAGVQGLPSVFNAVITISTFSVANSCTYGATRTLQALAQHGMAPRILAYVDGKGRPVGPVIIQLLIGLLAFVSLSAESGTVFTWLFSISGLGLLFLWASICLCHIRFRQAWKAANRSINDLPFKSPMGVYGSYFAVILAVIILIITFYVALCPYGGPPNPTNFFQNYLSAPIILTIFALRKLWTRDWTLGVKLKDIDLDADRRGDGGLYRQREEEKEKRSFGRRMINAIF
ncbi:uncharacterized protein Z520_10365 [Fonsecaea multimorphosa CBS 102226]|uniref:Amino acid permease/ SLC12A domain-containing protein n=1 Tax=Fonsecaea multimorphosa CBS 102226 TaxID=1442371 RepID=A0A0D2KBK4_9EURO|nr:uncharacterized protein Z520_10365 [Fonsecaea multimorphosa CBS 102226]KIX94028.1 hypothetical protein Z520_10365 [Fonsecaea multimorphosa CBS 102226]OAL19374.1 hypothetical protein AYO22_09918 [Fonsecaea multimorphosa]